MILTEPDILYPRVSSSRSLAYEVRVRVCLALQYNLKASDMVLTKVILSTTQLLHTSRGKTLNNFFFINWGKSSYFNFQEPEFSYTIKMVSKHL